jgi:hypothetical protein
MPKIDLRGNQFCRKYKINQKFFKIWSPDMAYILGFWFADGNIYEDCFKISQHKKDKYILNKMLKAMKATYHIRKENKNNVGIQIYSQKIVDDIKKLGGKERKSLDVKFPKIPIKYLGPFVRGYFDGDGCVCISKANNNLSIEFTTGSKDFAYGLLKTIEKNTNARGKIYIKIRKAGEKLFEGIRKTNSTYYSVRFFNNESIKLREFIYKYGDFKLKRKYIKLYKIKDIRILKNNFMSFKEAKNFVRKLKLNSKSEWEWYLTAGKRPLNLPSQPSRKYKNKGWISWKNWLGYTKEKVKGDISCWEL